MKSPNQTCIGFHAVTNATCGELYISRKKTQNQLNWFKPVALFHVSEMCGRCGFLLPAKSPCVPSFRRCTLFRMLAKCTPRTPGQCKRVPEPKKSGNCMSDREHTLLCLFCLSQLLLLLLALIIGMEVTGGVLADESCFFWARKPVRVHCIL